MDRILIKDLLLRCIIGINQEERREKQDVVINITLFTDLRLSGKTDRFEDTVDYRAIKKKIIGAAENSNFLLIEALAQHVADMCLKDSRVNRVIVSVEKPGALRFARSVAVEIERERD